MTEAPGAPAPAVCILGAAGDTGNLGVTALLHATLAGLTARLPSTEVTVFDNGWGVRDGRADLGGRDVRYRLCGIRLSRRLHRPESLANVHVSSRLGGLSNPAAQAIVRADAVLDISGGDSFSDIYGRRRYRMVTVPKRLVLARGRPLLLLPQTYGPFSGRRLRQAGDIVGRATAAWARDADSHQHLQRLLGPAYDPARHHSGVDVAFALPPSEPPGELDDWLLRWLAPDRDAPVAGLNVSGLLANGPGARERFGLTVDYAALHRAFVRRLLEEGDARVVLVPHVVGGGAESDLQAVEQLVASVPPEHASRVAVAPLAMTPGQVKWLIGQLDWFCGTRMHSTIAALSSGVPAAAVAYSLKTRGVFGTCGLAGEVIDAREVDERTAVASMLDAWRRRDATRAGLASRLPSVVRRAGAQMDAIAGAVATLAGSPPPGRRGPRTAAGRPA